MDEFPDLHELFLHFNELYFQNALSGIEVKWSSKMTLCAGLCYYHFKQGFCSIRLSEKLLQFRPKQDFINTLLHEMIHAYLFVTNNNKDHDSHGPEFINLMTEINEKCGSSITIYHNFHEEVDYFRTHIWQCSGNCKNQPPFYGLVKRSMNRPPQKADWWFSDHQKSCGGTFVKISEPNSEVSQKAKSRKESLKAESKRKIEENQQLIDCFVVKEKKVDESIQELVKCPCCQELIIKDAINEHLDSCLSLFKPSTF